VQVPHSNSKKQSKSRGLKIPIFVGIPVLILIIIGGAYSQGFFDNTFEKYTSEDTIENVADSKSIADSTVSNDEITVPTETNSKCGPGTVLNQNNQCVLQSEINSADATDGKTGTSSKCGPGTVLNQNNQCVLDK